MFTYRYADKVNDETSIWQIDAFHHKLFMQCHVSFLATAVHCNREHVNSADRQYSFTSVAYTYWTYTNMISVVKYLLQTNTVSSDSSFSAAIFWILRAVGRSNLLLCQPIDERNIVTKYNLSYVDSCPLVYSAGGRYHGISSYTLPMLAQCQQQQQQPVASELSYINLTQNDDDESHGKLATSSGTVQPLSWHLLPWHLRYAHTTLFWPCRIHQSIESGIAYGICLNETIDSVQFVEPDSICPRRQTSSGELYFAHAHSATCTRIWFGISLARSASAAVLFIDTTPTSSRGEQRSSKTWFAQL